jgi:CheY-like chemotaxis protein
VQRNLPSVFIVDDEQVIADTLTTILQKNGFTATYFTDPLEALVAARNEAPDLILSDVMMPGLSGVELAMAIHRDCPNCKIMLFLDMHRCSTYFLLPVKKAMTSISSRSHFIQLIYSVVSASSIRTGR